MNNPFGSIAGGINDTVDAYRSNPGPLNKELQQNAKKPLLAQSLIKLMAAELINKEQAAKENELRASMKVDSRTVADKTYEQLYGKKEQEIANRVAMVERGKQLQRRKAMDNLAKRQGIGALPTSLNQRPTGVPTNKMAGGGVVAFQAGGDEGEVEVDAGFVQDSIDYLRKNPGTSIAGGLSALGALAYLNDAAKLVNPARKIMLPFKMVRGLMNAGVKRFRGPKTTKGGQGDQLELNPNDPLYKVNTPPRTTFQRTQDAADSIVSGTQKLGRGLKSPAGIATTGGIAYGLSGDSAEEQAPPTSDLEAIAEEQRRRDAEEMLQAGIDREIRAEQPSATDLRNQKIDAATQRARENILGQQVPIPRAYNRDNTLSETMLSDAYKKQERGLGSLRDNLETKRGEAEKIRNKAFSDMQANVDRLAGRGEFKQAAAMKDLLAALSTVGRGRNLGEGLGLGFRTLYNREDARARRAAQGDKDIAQFQADRIGAEYDELMALGELDQKTNQLNIDRLNAIRGLRTEEREAAIENEKLIIEVAKFNADLRNQSNTLQLQSEVKKLELLLKEKSNNIAQAQVDSEALYRAEQIDVLAAEQVTEILNLFGAGGPMDPSELDDESLKRFEEIRNKVATKALEKTLNKAMMQ